MISTQMGEELGRLRNLKGSAKEDEEEAEVIVKEEEGEYEEEEEEDMGEGDEGIEADTTE